ncbi:MAG: GMP reductase [Duodenibacillus massiliensis]
MHIDNEPKLDFKDVLIRPKRSTLTSRSQVDITREIKFHHTREVFHAVPVIAANMDTTGTFEMARVLGSHGMMTALHKHYAPEEYIEFFRSLKNKSDAFYSMGIGDADYRKFETVMKAVPGEIRYVCIDVANGYTEAFVSFVKKVRDTYPDLVIMAGNVVTGDMTEELVLAGADIVKVGIGPGSVCTTRKMTGVGYPQLSAVIECADAAHGLGGRICSDGGCTQPGDVAKAFGGGADFVMLGGMFAGHNESGGEVREINGKRMRGLRHELQNRHGQIFGRRSEVPGGRR